MTSAKKKILAILNKLEPAEAQKVMQEISESFAKEGEGKKMVSANVSPEFVNEIFTSKLDSGSFPDIDKVTEGLGLVSFDLENFECSGDDFDQKQWGGLIGPRMFGKIPGIGCYGGGDWEYPLFFIIYLDLDGKTLRSYVPKDGNIWNYDTKSAFGNDENGDREFIEKWARANLPGNSDCNFDRLDVLDLAALIMFNPEKIIKDIEARIIVSEKK